jgi:tRNA dimethylallyltransferase
LRSVGYRQIGEVLQGAKTVVEALEEMKQETRRLAKRQLTWYRADTDIHWYHPEKQQGGILGAARQFLESPL